MPRVRQSPEARLGGWLARDRGLERWGGARRGNYDRFAGEGKAGVRSVGRGPGRGDKEEGEDDPTERPERTMFFVEAFSAVRVSALSHFPNEEVPPLAWPCTWVPACK